MARANTDAHKSIYLTDASVAALPYARRERGVYVARDTEIIGFRCIVNRSTRHLPRRRRSRSLPVPLRHMHPSR